MPRTCSSADWAPPLALRLGLCIRFAGRGAAGWAGLAPAETCGEIIATAHQQLRHQGHVPGYV